jgi:hypothetical protein
MMLWQARSLKVAALLEIGSCINEKNRIPCA